MNPLLGQITKLKCLWEHIFHFSKAPRPPWKEKFHLIQCPPDALEIFCQCFYTCMCVRVICLLGTKSWPRIWMKCQRHEIRGAYKHLVVSEMPYS
jgi:hypothetical protein